MTYLGNFVVLVACISSALIFILSPNKNKYLIKITYTLYACLACRLMH